MDQNEIRYQVTACLLQATDPLSLDELAGRCAVPRDELAASLKKLVAEDRVVQGDLVPDRPGPHYCWATRWEHQASRRAMSRRRELGAVMGSVTAVPEAELCVDSEPSERFYAYVINEYRPPTDKRYLVFLQCSVRRPFSSSPSHAAMRRAIALATGYDPRKEFESCPVHVVVLASKIGPVPYELEKVYPANVRGGGVKHFSRESYARVKPILADRMIQYVLTHRRAYERIAAFAHGRYAEVMEAGQKLAAESYRERMRFPILPVADGPRIARIGGSRPRQYWACCWIQLYLEIVSWLEPAEQAQAQARLDELDVEYHDAGARLPERSRHGDPRGSG
jgi:hypothetical protein